MRVGFESGGPGRSEARGPDRGDTDGGGAGPGGRRKAWRAPRELGAG